MPYIRRSFIDEPNREVLVGETANYVNSTIFLIFN